MDRKNKIAAIIGVLALLAFAAPTIFRTVPLGGRTVDTAYGIGSLKIDSTVRFGYYANTDTNKVLSLINGFPQFVTKGGNVGTGIKNNIPLWNTGNVLTTSHAYDSSTYFTITDSLVVINVPTLKLGGDSIFFFGQGTGKARKGAPYRGTGLLSIDSLTHLISLLAGSNNQVIKTVSGVAAWAWLDTNSFGGFWKTYVNYVATGGVTSFNTRTGAVVPAANDYTAELIGASSLFTITYASSFALNGNNGHLQKVVMGGSTSFTLSNIIASPIPYVFEVYQDATGSRVLTWGTTVKVAYGGAGTPLQSTAANAIDIYIIRFDGTNYFVDYGTNYN